MVTMHSQPGVLNRQFREDFMFILKTKRLRAEISEPGECPNNNVRFDRAGFISDITLDGAIHFCANEPKNLAHPSTGGRGLCCGYRYDFSAEAGTNEYFPKLGIGLIRKKGDEPYVFYGKYDDIQYFPVTFSHDETSAVFDIEPIECMGYAVREHKKISVDDNTLTMEVTMVNVGEKPIRTDEYCHNFFSIDGMAISPDYHLDLPMLKGIGVRDIPNIYPTDCNFHADGTGIEVLRTEVATSLSKVPLDGLEEKTPFVWTLSNKGAKAKVTCEEGFVPCGITLWETDHIFSPEVFHVIDITPGESTTWTRKYIFEVME